MFDPTKVRRRRHIRHLYAALGWLVYLYAWRRVLPKTPGIEIAQFAAVLLISLALIHSGAYLWIEHNKRLAARGNRGLQTRYTSPRFSHDTLGRTLLLDQSAVLSGEIILRVQGNEKQYFDTAGHWITPELELLEVESEYADEVLTGEPQTT